MAFAQQRKGRDPVLAEVLRQTKAAAQKVSGMAVPTGEPARQVANALRLFAAHGTTIGFDAAFSTALREAVAREGRYAVLARRPDVKALTASLGLDIDPARFGLHVEDDAKRAAVLDAALKNGFGKAWSVVAQSLDDIAARLDSHRGAQLVKQSGADCASGQWGLFWLEFTMITACGPWAGPLWVETCGIATAMYITYRLSLMIMGCL